MNRDRRGEQSRNRGKLQNFQHLYLQITRLRQLPYIGRLNIGLGQKFPGARLLEAAPGVQGDKGGDPGHGRPDRSPQTEGGRSGLNGEEPGSPRLRFLSLVVSNTGFLTDRLKFAFPA
jgi:hypothetical protein